MVLLKSSQVESEQQKLQDLNQEHTQNLLVSDEYTFYTADCAQYHKYLPLMCPRGILLGICHGVMCW